MAVFRDKFSVRTRGKGTLEITSRVCEAVARSDLRDGIVHVFCQHTSASLVIMENADPSVQTDLEQFMGDLVPEDYGKFTHTMEGLDDMPSHLRVALTRTSETIPLDGGRMMLGTWQGIFLWEHRAVPHTRHIVVTVIGE